MVFLVFREDLRLERDDLDESEKVNSFFIFYFLIDSDTPNGLDESLESETSFFFTKFFYRLRILFFSFLICASLNLCLY